MSKTMHSSQAVLIALVVILTAIPATNSSVIRATGAQKCDYRKWPKSGCEHAAQVCDPKLKQCSCRPGYVTSPATGECLRARHWNESCVSSLQCRTAHTACLAIDGTYHSWRCQCVQPAYWYDQSSSRCRERYHYGQACGSEGQCRTGLVCTGGDSSVGAGSNGTVCKCPPEYSYNTSAHECQHRANKGCPTGQHWNKHSHRCEPHHYSNRAGSMEATGAAPTGKSNAIIKNSKLINKGSAYWTQTTGAGQGSTTTTVARDETDTDEKILEIILEVSFLIVCLLAYQACSKACCPDDNESDETTGADIDAKSDEESMLSSAGSQHTLHTTPPTPTGGPPGGRRTTTAQAFKRHQRRVRKVFCKSRGGSTQKLIPIQGNGSPGGLSPNKYKNIIVRFDDKGSAGVGNGRQQCYNCRIYKEVYSPNARCKVCRASIIAQGLDADMEYGMSSDGKQLLPLPPYRGKPIRRSEEVGVPPHLKAPYVNNQPFWLK